LVLNSLRHGKKLPLLVILIPKNFNSDTGLIYRSPKVILPLLPPTERI
jgi:hypothetical protein